MRYVYQPLEGLYGVLITNKFSNIIEDLEILRLLVKLVSMPRPQAVHRPPTPAGADWSAAAVASGSRVLWRPYRG